MVSLKAKVDCGFAKVCSATLNIKDENFDEVVSPAEVQKPANDWECYLLRLNFLDHPDLGAGAEWSRSFMSASRYASPYQDGSIIVSKLNRFGTVLDMINATNSADKTVLVTIELLSLVEILHSPTSQPDAQRISNRSVQMHTHDCFWQKAIDLKFFLSNVLFDEFVITS